VTRTVTLTRPVSGFPSVDSALGATADTRLALPPRGEASLRRQTSVGPVSDRPTESDGHEFAIEDKVAKLAIYEAPSALDGHARKAANRVLLGAQEGTLTWHNGDGVGAGRFSEAAA